MRTPSGEKEKRYTSMYKKLRSYIIDNNLQHIPRLQVVVNDVQEAALLHH